MTPCSHVFSSAFRPSSGLAALALVLALSLASRASAQTWTEGGDAGPLPGTAQVTVGTTALTTLNGSLSSLADVDMYCIHVNVPGTFAASLQCVVIQGPNLWLFDANGKGISASTTCSGGGKSITGVYLPVAGNYYVAVAYDNVYPFSGGNAMWLPVNTGERAPDGPGSAGAITSWQGTGILQPINPYQVTFTNTGYCTAAVPALDPTWGRVKQTYR